MSCTAVVYVDYLGIRSWSYYNVQMLSPDDVNTLFHKSTEPVTTTSNMY